MSATHVHLAVCAAAMAIAGCAGDDLPPSRPLRPCTASAAAIDDYVGRIAGLVSNQGRGGVLARHEEGRVSFALAADGSASEFRLVRASRPAVGEEVLRAAEAAAPFPPPPFEPTACLMGGRAEVGLIGHVRCDDARSDEYIEAVSAIIRDAVNRAELTAPERERITLRIKVDRQGAPAIAVQDAPSAASGERVASVARKVGPFEPPDESIVECVSEQPFWIWLELPGISRPPVRIR